MVFIEAHTAKYQGQDVIVLQVYLTGSGVFIYSVMHQRKVVTMTKHFQEPGEKLTPVT